jgi:acyl-CoA reductase-like NAD-dependent aldehyde dehydrogenase
MPQHKLYIVGEWVESEGKDRWLVHSPATGELLGEIPMATEADVDRAVEAAQQARRVIADMTVFERSTDSVIES